MFKRCYEVAGITNKDRIHITPGYGLWTAGIGFQNGCEKLGAMAIPMGPGNTNKQIQMMQDMKSTVLCSTSSYALLLAEEIEKRGIQDKIMLKKGVIVDNAPPHVLTEKIAGSVWIVPCSESAVPEMQNRYRVTNISRDEMTGDVLLRVLNGEKPADNAHTVAPTLEDYYLWVFGEENAENGVDAAGHKRI